jgi:hypothetical protein
MDYSSNQKLKVFVVDVKLLWIYLYLLGNKNTRVGVSSKKLWSNTKIKPKTQELVYPVRSYGQTQKPNQKHGVLRGPCSRMVTDN